MKDLIIFGDSFAEEYLQMTVFKFFKNDSKIVKSLSTRNELISYHGLLRQSNQFNSVFSYGISGDDLWSQFKKFQEVYSGKEQVIFFETAVGRITSPEGIQCPNYYTINYLRDLILKSGSSLHDTDIDKILKAGADYFLYLQRDDFDTFANTAIINKIKEICAHALIIPCFKNSITYNGVSLSDISNYEFDPDYDAHYFEIRRNHLTEENHEILANQIINYFISDNKINFELFDKKPNTNFNRYFVQL